MSSVKHYLGCALGFLISGLNPLYWVALKSLPCEELLYHRSVWTALTLFGVLALLPRHSRKLLRNWQKDLPFLILSTLCLGLNWFSYIWAVNHGLILDASIAYFISPLISVVLSTIVLHEKQSRKQWLAFACCLFGVLSYALVTGHIPSLALLIASSFSLYGMLTKFMITPSLQRMLFEAVLGSVVVSICLHQHCSLANITTYNTTTALLLMGSGLITALPGFLLIQSARNLPYSVVGILNYIVPSTIFCLGVFHFGELLSYPKLFMVACIWVGVLIYFRCMRPPSRA